MKEIVIKHLKDQQKWLLSHLYYWEREEFQFMCYEIWAGKELLHYIRNHSKIPVKEAIEQFRDLMDDYSCEHECICFSVAYDVATDVLDLVIGEENSLWI